MAGFKKWASKAWDKLKGTFKKFGAEDGSLTAAAISFYALLTVMPLLLLGVASLGYIVGSSEKAFKSVVGFFNSFMPTSTFVVDTLRGLVSARGAIGLVGLLALVWTGSQFFVTVETALNDVWEVGKKPGYIKTRLKGILMVLVFGVFLLVSIGSTAFTGVLHSGVGSGATGSVLLRVLGIIVGVVFSIAMFLVVYKWLPDTEVDWKSAFYAAIFAGIAWSIAKELYTVYLGHFANFNKLYGSLGSVIILVMWIYYSSVIMVIGAELGYVYEHGPQERAEEAERMQK